MNLEEMKRTTLALIEELNPNSALLTDDPDIAAKFNTVTNHIMFELARMKKIPKYLEIKVARGETLDFGDLERECGYEVYQIDRVCGASCTRKADGTVLKFTETGTAEIDVFVYPERITEQTRPRAYEFELSNDVLEIMPYGIAADLLKSDVSASYGSIYAARYNELLQRLDYRYQMSAYTMEGGVEL